MDQILFPKNANNGICPLNKPQNDGALNLGDKKSGENNVNSDLGNETSDEVQLKLRTFRKLKFCVDGATEIDFRVFKGELEKVRKEAITMGEALRALLEIANLAKMLSKCMPREYRSMFPYWRG